MSQRVFFEKFLGDPSYFNQVKKDFSIGDYLLSRFEHTFKHHLVKDNHFLTFLFCGQYLNEKGLPVYLLEENYDIIKHNLHRVEIVTDRIDPYLASLPAQSIDKYSLSDISGWIPLEEFRSILEDVKRTMSKSGRLCYRNFLAKRTLSEVGIAGLRQDRAMMNELDAADRAFAFSFEVAQKEDTHESVL
ncbi:S-adenosylmethionine:diacylglycerol 3-amino-3-carboxypropyl transferase [Bacillus sp. JCM 19047]|nr:S-adenosylmethionine:diacylglycerol 3-amino-3-carboxypropyl transferase [Bacillus sp. JCM 19047]